MRLPPPEPLGGMTEDFVRTDADLHVKLLPPTGEWKWHTMTLSRGGKSVIIWLDEDKYKSVKQFIEDWCKP